MRFSHLIFRPKNIPQVGQNIVSFGLNSSSVRVKDGQMHLIKGLLHSPKKCKFDSCSLALPPQGDCNYCITYWFYRCCGHKMSILSAKVSAPPDTMGVPWCIAPQGISGGKRVFQRHWFVCTFTGCSWLCTKNPVSMLTHRSIRPF